ncbi:hypothetical protein PsYK624_006380 [Phanerochaete sordida]|uniref:Uncharacterized protein n=1 Tax=Phanerochaete sordida TaxID=48140 RepID=A0A9P3FWU8_9APHY|nr:hypothetical protein PsYK624_006380 [Phanerochaete sordida]
MLPIVPTLVLAFISFISSAFVILRIIIPILPPHPLSRRVPPSEFGLPNFKSLSAADKSHIWLAACDILALAIFVWQAASEYLGGPTGSAIITDPGSAIRLWIATTLRQTCLLIVAALTLVHVRLGQPVAFGAKHWMLWCPTLLLTATSTVLAGVLAGAGVETFFWGMLGYSASVAVASSVAFGCLIGTLIIIRRNLAALDDMREPWPPASAVTPVTPEKPRSSFATEDIQALKDGSSWITSRASSRCESVSAFSFSTHHTGHSRGASTASARAPVHPAAASHTSIPVRSPFWFAPPSPAPPVPPLPAPFRAPEGGTYNVADDPDPFRRIDPRIRMGSQSSWLSETPGWQHEASMSQWSFPASSPPSPYNSTNVSTPAGSAGHDYLSAQLLPTAGGVSRPVTPVRTSVLGGYGFAPDVSRAETSGAGLTSVMGNGEVDVSVYRAIGWLVTIWLPTGFCIPYYITSQMAVPSPAASLLMVLSVTISAPLLAANILLRSPIPIPSGLFDTSSEPPSVVYRAPTPCSSQAEDIVREYKRSGSTTVVDHGHRSGDVWLANGNASEGKSKVARALTMLQPKPKLSVLPPQEEDPIRTVSPPKPMPDADGMYNVPLTPQRHKSAEVDTTREFGTRKKDSKASSYYSGADDSVAIATQIMIAQRHYSALATTVKLPPSPKRMAPERAATTAVEVAASPERRRHSHLRARSGSSLHSIPHSAISGPPSTPLPPTPPALRLIKARHLAHRRSYSSADEFSFGPIEHDNTHEIDALSAGLLPLLVPGVGADIRVTEGWKSSPTVMAMHDKGRLSQVPAELGALDDIPSPRFHSTPHTKKAETQAEPRKASHKNHFSLSSLNLGRDGLHALSSWGSDLRRALDSKPSQYETLRPDIPEIRIEETRRTTVYGGEYVEQYLKAAGEDDSYLHPDSPGFTTGFPPSESLDVPESINMSRNSLLTLISALDDELQAVRPSSAASDATLFDFDPHADGAAASTPHELKTKHFSHDGAAPRAASPDMAGRTAPVVRPLAPKSKPSKHRAKKPSDGQENVAPPGLRPLALVPSTRPLALGKGMKPPRDKELRRLSELGENGRVRRDSGLKRALKPLRLGRSETTKQRAALREQELLPDVVVRPPSDGQHVGFSYSFNQ